jgi:uncharacterized membrane protein
VAVSIIVDTGAVPRLDVSRRADGQDRIEPVGEKDPVRARVGAAAVAVAAIGIVSSCTVPVTDLGGSWSVAYSVNDAGEVVGQSALEDSSVGHAFKRRPDGSAVDLLPNTDEVSSAAYDINDAGTAVGIAGVAGRPLDFRVVVWDTANQLTDLGFEAMPRDINDAGVFVGHNYFVGPRDAGYAFVYDPAVGHPVALPELAGGLGSSAWGLNDAGQVVGTVTVDDPEEPGRPLDVPVRWDLAAGTVTDLRDALGLGLPTEIADDGTIIGQSSDLRAAIWSPGVGDPTYLTADAGIAVGINTDGTVVGFGWEAGGRAFRWHADGGLVWLAEADGSSFAYAINEAGHVVGSSRDKAALLLGENGL